MVVVEEEEEEVVVEEEEDSGGGEVNSSECCSWLDCFHCKGNGSAQMPAPPPTPHLHSLQYSASVVLRSQIKHDLHLREILV